MEKTINIIKDEPLDGESVSREDIKKYAEKYENNFVIIVARGKMLCRNKKDKNIFLRAFFSDDIELEDFDYIDIEKGRLVVFRT